MNAELSGIALVITSAAKLFQTRYDRYLKYGLEKPHLASVC